MFVKVSGRKSTPVIRAFFFGILSIALSTAVFAITIDDLDVIPTKVLDQGGISGDIALHPLDKSVHAIWVKNGDIRYVVRYPTGAWSSVETIPDKGYEVFGSDETDSTTGPRPRKFTGITIDDLGFTHIVYGTAEAKIFHIMGTPGHWGEPEKIANSPAIYTEIEVVGDRYVVTWENGGKDEIYTMLYQNGAWSSPISMGRGEYPSLAKNDEGTVYFLTRNRAAPRQVRFAYLLPDSDTWQFNYDVTNASNRVGEGPQIGVGDGKLYIAWCNADSLDTQDKAQIHCAYADEPGTKWYPRLGTDEPLWYDNTAAPHPRVAVFHDGTVLLLTGRRLNRQFMIYNENGWSTARPAPWNSGIAQVASDGFTVWVMISPYNFNNETEVSVSGIKTYGPDHADDLDVSDKKVLDSSGFSGDVALDPTTGSLHAVWVHQGDIRHAERDIYGNWQPIQTVPDGGRNVYGASTDGFPKKCLALDVDEKGNFHLIFTTGNGNLYYSENWSSPVEIAATESNTIYLDIVSMGSTIYTVYERANTGAIYSTVYEDGQWQEQEYLGQGFIPSLKRGQNGMIYLLFQDPSGTKPVKFAYRVPGFTDWIFRSGVTDPQHECGLGYDLAVGNGKLYLAWNNDTGVSSDWKSEIYCAMAEEPGDTWLPHLGTLAPLYYENTSDPFPRAAVYSDGRVLVLNGKRLGKRFMLWDGLTWSKTRNAPWEDGMPEVASDGETAWIMVSSIAQDDSEVSLTAITNTRSDRYDLTAEWPTIGSTPPLAAPLNGTYRYLCEVSNIDGDPLQFSLSMAPEGMSIDPLTGQIEWRPTQTDYTADLWGQGAGIHLVGVNVTDGRGGYASQYYWLEIEDSQNSAPYFTSTPDTSAEVGSQYLYRATAEDADGQELTFSVIQGPAGMIVDAQLGTVLWTPSEADTGSHNIILAVSDGRGGEATQTFVLHVRGSTSAPVADFIADITQGIVPLLVKFTDRSTGQVQQWSWDFGDNSSSQQQNPSHLYTKTGTYSVKLVSYGPGGTDSLTRSDYIRVLAPTPVARFGASPTSGSVPLTVQFSDSSTGAIDQWFWDFGDNTTSSQQNPLHTYPNPGQYSVTLRVSGSGGEDSESKENYITVQESTPHANFSAQPTEGSAPLTVGFTDLSEGTIISWQWDFGDNSTSAQQNPTHTYAIAGTYTVALHVSGPAGSDTTVQRDLIHVFTPKPVALFGAQPTEGVAPLTVQFIDSSTGQITSRTWNFGDLTTSDVQNPIHTYSQPGVYTVSLQVSGPAGSDTTSMPDLIRVYHQEPVAQFSASPLSGHAPLSVQFSDASTGLIDNWQWNFGDNTFSTEKNPNHVYTVPGSYAVQLVVSGPVGSDSLKKQDYIQVNEETVLADFSAFPREGQIPLVVQFRDSSDGVIDSWTWDFGDGTSSQQQNPIHIYQKTGFFTVSLTVSGTHGSDTHAKTDYIKVSEPAPKAGFSADRREGTSPLQVKFTDKSTGRITSWLWIFGDNTSSTEQHPTHLYESAGIYTVSLKVTGPGGTDSLAVEAYITAKESPPRAQFSAFPTTGPAPLTVRFTDSSMGIIESWLWDFGDNSTSTDKTPTHVYESAGVYTVRLSVSGPSGADTLSLLDHIKVTTITDVAVGEAAPREFRLFQNYPNPFNAGTTILYHVPAPAYIMVAVYDINGKLITRLYEGSRETGAFKVTWSGRDQYGHQVASGLYLIQMRTDGFIDEKKVLYLK